jgi:hypothetical protein
MKEQNKCKKCTQDPRGYCCDKHYPLPHTTTEEGLREELALKMCSNFAKGGFLTTDLDGEWEYDEEEIIKWFLSKFTQAQIAVLEKVEKEVGDDSELVVTQLPMLSYNRGYIDGINKERSRIHQIIAEAKKELE